MHFDWTQGALAEGLRCYREREFFEAHEAWESVWLSAPEPEKTFLQALIQVTAAFHHLQRKNPLGAGRLLQGALRRLEGYPEYFGGLAAASLRDQIRERLQALTIGELHLEPVRIEPSVPPPADSNDPADSSAPSDPNAPSDSSTPNAPNASSKPRQAAGLAPRKPNASKTSRR